jgi:hypothetical protein
MVKSKTVRRRRHRGMKKPLKAMSQTLPLYHGTNILAKHPKRKQKMRRKRRQSKKH